MGEKFGHHYGRADMERIGLFAEMSYMHGKGYTAPIIHNEIRDKKMAQMHPGVPKWKTGLQDCYFDQKFKRIFEKEAYTTPYIMEVNAQKEVKKKYPNLRPFSPSPYPKKHATPGDFFGTFGGQVKAFSPILKPRPPKETLPPNVRVNPGKKGGPGYPDICLNKFPQYKSTPYDDPKSKESKKKDDKSVPFLGISYPNYFDKNPYLTKRIQPTYKEEFTKLETKSGPFYPSHKNRTLDGCFSKRPAYKSSPYTLPKPDKATKEKTAPVNEPFRPQARNKSMYTKSIMGNKVKIAVNTKNWRNFKPITYTREFLV
uniref:Cilia-and flagella-associated protein 96 n=1 Tax=Cuerna arida TaxID=1464854 RepID=A0A1B6FZX7_9HEMI